MKTIPVIFLVPAFFAFTSRLVAQAQDSPKVIFALIEEGKFIEPIARLEKDKLLPALDGEGGIEFNEFAELYYKPGSVYRISTGGKLTGNTTIIKNDPGSDCGGIMAEVKTVSPALRITANELSLATNYKPLKPAAGFRRNANATEKIVIEKLVKAAFNKKIILVKELKQMKLTAIDVDNDKQPELVGTYICKPKLKQRAVIFFIAAKTKTGAYTFQFSEIEEYSEDELMSGDITSVDDGIYQERLLDILDIDNSGVTEVFTTKPSFEGAAFTVYQRKGNVWEKALEVANYHCGY